MFSKPIKRKSIPPITFSHLSEILSAKTLPPKIAMHIQIVCPLIFEKLLIFQFFLTNIPPIYIFKTSKVLDKAIVPI